MNKNPGRLTRRRFCAAAALAPMVLRSLEANAMGASAVRLVEAKAITRGPNHHFFGYYEKCPWDATGRYVLAMENPFMDRMPRPDDALTVGRIDRQEGDRFEPLDRTLAWCWQQGTMLRWMPGAEDRCILYNMREGETFYSAVRDVTSGQVRRLPRPIYAASPTGAYALTLNFARLATTRPGYGYDGGRDPWKDHPHAAKDGVHRMDMKTGESRLVFSLDAAANLRPKPSMKDATHWFNHIQINPDGTRFAVLHRWAAGRSWTTRALTMNPDGSDVYVLADDGMFSHYDWYGPDRLVGWANKEGVGRRYFIYTDRTDRAEVLGDGVLTTDGHLSFPPDRRWMLTDTYPDKERKRTLLLWRMADGARVDIGRFYAPPEIDGPTRCDLHPRWNRDGTQVCIDSAHEGSRQMYVLDVGEIVRA